MIDTKVVSVQCIPSMKDDDGENNQFFFCKSDKYNRRNEQTNVEFIDEISRTFCTIVF